MKTWLRYSALWCLGAGVAAAADMTALRYLDRDPGDPPYLTRILVTPDFMRMDGGDDDGDFVLLDRRQRRVINVMRGSGLAMVFAPGALPPKPADWRSRLSTAAAADGGRSFSLAVDGTVCSEGVAAPGSAPDAARAMAELKGVLAATQYRVWRDSPQELQHDCDLANLVWESGATLGVGLPLEEREFSGRSRLLETETTLPLQPELFRLPDGVVAIDAPS